MRIGVFISALLGGGAERVMLNVANGLSLHNKLEIIIIVCKAKGPYLNMVDEKVTLVNLGDIKLYQARKPLAKVIDNYGLDVVLSALPYQNMMVLLAAKTAMRNCKVIVSEHGYALGNVKKNRSLKEKLIPLMIKLFYHHAERVVCVSKGVESYVHCFDSRLKAMTTVIYNPVIPLDIKEKSMETPEILFDSNGKKLKLLGCGRLTEQKNFKLLIATVRHLIDQGIECVLYIMGEGEDLNDLQEYVLSLNLITDVKFIGFIKNPYAVMRGCDIFVLSSLWEGFGNVLVEAAACGCKIVSTDCKSGPSEIIEDLQFGYLSGFDSCDLAEIIKKAINDNKILDIQKLEKYKNKNVIHKYADLILSIG